MKNQVFVWFLIFRKHTGNIQQLEGINLKIASCTLKLNTQHSIKIIQIYATTTVYLDEELITFYDDLYTAIETPSTKCNNWQS